MKTESLRALCFLKLLTQSFKDNRGVERRSLTNNERTVVHIEKVFKSIGIMTITHIGVIVIILRTFFSELYFLFGLKDTVNFAFAKEFITKLRLHH